MSTYKRVVSKQKKLHKNLNTLSQVVDDLKINSQISNQISNQKQIQFK